MRLLALCLLLLAGAAPRARAQAVDFASSFWLLGRPAPRSPAKIQPAFVSAQPAAEVKLSEVQDRHFKTADGYGSGKDRIHLSVHFDLAGEAYLSVLGAGWEAPNFYKFERAMNGSWEAGGARHWMSLDVSIWRARLNNVVQVFAEGRREPVFERRIVDILKQAYRAGREVRVGRQVYRLYYSNSVDSSVVPAVKDPQRMGLVLVQAKGDEDCPDFKTYIIPAAAVTQERTYRTDLDNGQTLGLRMGPDGTLLLYDLGN